MSVLPRAGSRDANGRAIECAPLLPWPAVSTQDGEGPGAVDLTPFEELVDAAVAAYAPGEIVVEAGSQASEVFVVVEGAVEVLASEDGATMARLGRGAVVGELAAMAGGVRTATVRASGPARLLRMDRTVFLDLLDDRPDLARSISDEAVRRLDSLHLREALARLLGRPDEEVVAEVEDAAQWIRLDAGTVLFDVDEPADAGYLVINGRLRVLDRDGRLVGEIARDEFVGEQGLVLGSRRLYRVVAVRDSLLVEIRLERFLDLVNRHPSVLVPVVTEVVRRSSTPRTRRRERAVAVAVCTDLNSRVFCSKLSQAMEAEGTVAHVWSARVDATLGRPGVAQSPPESPGAIQVGRLLHELELDNTYLLCEADVPGSAWSSRVARQADRVVVVISSEPDEEEVRVADRFLQDGSTHATRIVAVAHPSSADRPRDSSRILERWPGVEIVHLRSGSASDIGRLARLLSGSAYGLVLGGGGARGFAHLGVYRAMSELGIPIDLVAGSSIGAPVAGGIAQGLVPTEGVEAAVRLFRNLLDYTIPVVSLVKGERITQSIAAQFDGWDIEDMWTSFFCVSTNLTRATEMVHRRGPATPAIRASVSIPGVMPPVADGEDLLVDGGVLNNLPADVMRSWNPTGTVIAVDVAPPRGPRAKGELDFSVSGWAALTSRFRGGNQYPGISAVMMRTLITASVNRREQILGDGTIDCYLDLDMRGVGLLDFDEVRSVADAGYEAAMPRLEAWLASTGGL